MDLVQFLSYLALSGGNVLAASWVLERVAWFQAKTAEAKQYIFFAVAAVIGVGAYAGMTYIPADILDAIAPYFLVIAGTFSTVMLGNAFHLLDKQGKK